MGYRKSPANTLKLDGKTFGKLTVIRRDGSTDKGNSMWLCRCECGNTCRAMGTSLRRLETTSCGCSKGDQITNARNKLMTDHTKDGMQIPLLKKKVRSDSGTGIKGVAKRVRKGRVSYEAHIRLKGKRYTRSRKTLEEAIKARKELEKEYFKPYLEDDNDE